MVTNNMATRAEALSRKEGHVGAVAFSRCVSRKFKPGRNDGEPRRCAYRKSSPSILVMQSTQDRTAQNASRCLGGT